MRFRTVSALLTLLVATPASADPKSWALEGWKTDFDNIVIDPDEIATVILRDQIPSIATSRPIAWSTARSSRSCTTSRLPLSSMPSSRP